MQVKQRLRINSTILALSVIAVTVVLSVTAQRLVRAMEQNHIADTLMNTQFERLALRTDYMRSGSERAREQIRAKNEQVGELLKSAAEMFSAPLEQKTVAELMENQKAIGNIFRAILSNRANAGSKGRSAALSIEIENRLLTQLNMRVYEAVLLGDKLQESSHEAILSSLKTGGASIAVVVLLMGAATLINSVTMSRMITGRIGRLREGAAIIGDGDLAHRIDVKGADEFTELAGAFNEMTSKLRDSYHHLENEIEERKRAEELVKASLHEKEVLLKEVHHRVKNNLQVISSLVSMQAADDLRDETVREVLSDVTCRVRSMALVHEKLYHSESLARIDFAEYAKSLLGYLWRAHGSAGKTVRLTLDLEPVELPVDTATPCGLILNELAGNALKHAFRGRNEGEVIVTLLRGDDGRVSLSVRDNGVGLPEGFDWRQAKSLGLRLVQMLAGQLRAEIMLRDGEGTAFTVVFG